MLGLVGDPEDRFSRIMAQLMLIQSAETQSGLPLLPWSCYASVIQCDIIQYLLFLFYYYTGIISFLAIYNDTILCTIFCVSERLYAKKHCF